MKIKNNGLKFSLKLFLFGLILGSHATHPIDAEAIRTVANGGLTSFSQQGTSVDWLEPWRGRGNASLGFTINLFGSSISSIWVRPQGYLSPANSGYNWAYVDFFTSNTQAVLAPYEGPWDPANNPAPYGTAIINGRSAFVASWIAIGGKDNLSATGSFQVVIIDRSDTGNGNFDMEFNYGSIKLNSTWDGNQAFVGFTSGNSDNAKWALPGTGINGKFRNTDPTPVINYRNTETDRALKGRLVFESRNGVISSPNYTSTAYTIPTTITINITAANTVTLFSLGELNVSTKNLLIQTSAYAPARNETFRLLNYGSGQFSNITLPTLDNGLAWDLSNLYTTGVFSVIRSPDNLGLFKPYVWLDASDTGTIKLNGSTVEKWYDKSGNNNHATQTTSASQPTYVTNVVNSKPVLRFDGANDCLSFATQLFAGSGARTIIAVMKRNNANSAPIYADNTGGAQAFGFEGSTLWYGTNGSTGKGYTDLTSSSVFRVAMISIDTSQPILKFTVNSNGVSLRSGDSFGAALNTSSSGTSSIGRTTSGFSFLNGDIAEILMYQRKLKPWEIDKITRYYREKYKIPGTETTFHPLLF